jgi:hypothetical protein
VTGSFAVARELHQDGERFRSVYNMTQECSKLLVDLVGNKINKTRTEGKNKRVLKKGF